MGILIVKTDELFECQQGIVDMMADGVVVLPRSYEVEYIRTDGEYDENRKVTFA